MLSQELAAGLREVIDDYVATRYAPEHNRVT